MYEHSGTSASLNCIKQALAENLEEKYELDSSYITNKLLKISGLHKSNFDIVGKVEASMEEQNLNNSSIDDNSNKNEKTILGILRENTNPFDKLIVFRDLYRQLKDLYGKQEATRLTGEVYDFSLGLADSTKIPFVYCWAFDASKIVLEGRPFGQVQSKPPQRLYSYISALNESIHQLSNHLAGALAIGTLFIDAAKLLMLKENKHLLEVKENESTRKYIENCFQNFVHSVNHLSRNGIETPFTNISIFDRSKLKTILEEPNMRWYFEDQDLNYVIEYVMALQDIFMDFFDKGDPTKDGLVYRFPVVTINLSKDEEDNIEDKEFLESVCQRDVCKYNLFGSMGSHVASCCRLLSDSDMLEVASQSNSFGGSSISLGSHRVVTVNFNRIALETNSREEFFNRLEERIVSAAKILKAHKELIIDLEKKGLQPFITNGWINIDRLFSTFGILGIYEAVKTIKRKFRWQEESISEIIGEDITKDILEFLNKKVLEVSKEYNIIGNIEQIPAESFSHRLARADSLLFKGQVKEKLYSNQFVPLWEDASVWERMEADGKYNQLLTGGGICHIQLSDSITPTQAKELIEKSIEAGCEHFALNKIYSVCDYNHTTKEKVSICPICQSEKIDHITRVVGFFTPVSSWNQIKQQEDFEKRKYTSL